MYISGMGASLFINTVVDFSRFINANRECFFNRCFIQNIPFLHSGDVKEVGGLVLSAGRGTGLIKYEISIPPPTSVVQVQQLD